MHQSNHGCSKHFLLHYYKNIIKEKHCSWGANYVCLFFFFRFLKSWTGLQDLYDQRLCSYCKCWFLCPMCFQTVALFTNIIPTLLLVFREGSIVAILNNIFQNTNLTDEAVRDIIDVAINESTSEFFGNVTYDSKFCFLLYGILPSSAEGFF